MVLTENVLLAPYSTFRIGGVTPILIHAGSVAELKETEQYLRDTGNTLAVIGGGSNTLFGDQGFDGVVLKVEILGVDIKEDHASVVAVVGAGVLWDVFVADMVSRGFSGLENLSGIPGSVGASPIQNIGAYGKEVASIIEWVEVFDRVTKKTRRIDPIDCDFGYRDSLFKRPMGSSLIVTRVAFRLAKKSTPMIGYADLKSYFASWGSEPTLKDIRDAVLSIRAKKFPPLDTLGTAGSFFKNPVVSVHKADSLKHAFPDLPVFPVATGDRKISAAWLIEHVAKMKGYREGAVRTFEHQALVIVAEQGATAHDVIVLAKKISHEVKKITDVLLEPEVRFIGCSWNV